MKRVLLLASALAFASACAPSLQTPRFASWEPLTASIPSIDDRALARRALSDSRRIWKEFRSADPPSSALVGRPISQAKPPVYTYVRALQTDADRVTFTIVAVERGRVVLRALIDAHPGLLDRRIWSAPEPRALWVERGNQVGKNRDGAPALTIDELYDTCETRVLKKHPELAARLYFHPNGLLMQCGFAPGECDDCPTVSIHSVSRYSVALEPSWLAPSRWLCGTDWGLYPPSAADPLSSPSFDCRPAPVPEPAWRDVSVSTNDPQGDPEGEAKAEADGEDRGAESEPLGLADICRIDPAACPTYRCRGDCMTAKWMILRPSICMASPSRPPSFLEVGKRLPLDDWAFPFFSRNDIECLGGRVIRHVQPPTGERTPLERWERDPKSR